MLEDSNCTLFVFFFFFYEFQTIAHSESCKRTGTVYKILEFTFEPYTSQTGRRILMVRYRVRSAWPCARQWPRGWSPGKCNCPRAPTVCSWWALSCCTRSDRWPTVTVQTSGQAIGCFSATGCSAARRLWLSNTAIRRDRPRGNHVDLPWTDRCSAVLQYTRNMGLGKITRACACICVFFVRVCDMCIFVFFMYVCVCVWVIETIMLWHRDQWHKLILCRH